MLKRSYYGLLTTVTLSSFGDVFGLLAMEWLVYDLIASKLAMGAMALSFSVPEVVLRLLGSPLSDRLHRGRFMAGLASIRLLALLLPLSLGLAGQLHLWHLFLAAGLSGACSALFMPTAMAIVPGIADEHKLMRAFAVIDGCRSAAALLGPALAGAVTATMGALPTLGINAVCYAVAILTLLYLPKMQRPVAKEASLSLKTYVKDMGEGLSFYRNYPAMLSIMGMVSISNMSSIGIWTMMIPYVREVLHRDATAMGTLTTASALGTITGLAIISWIGEMKRRRTVMLCSLAATGFFNALLGLFPSYSLALFGLCAAGVAGPFFGSLSSSLHGTLVPAHLQGRVNSIRFLIGGGLQPLGALAGATVAEWYGLPFLFLSLGLLPLLCSVAAIFIPNLKDLNGDLMLEKLSS
ncbi:MFS family permease [Paenibacillus shirakamiensis]|uniref:MFS family permease n=1 Tax=Paenibacillus shirakamiensis TaxID=1265935 RepID=A0ABS4JEF1_9BACL|nr:MFS transporter [Paenibacillus shirakamiensis]MBP2000094.1 MFS family permease [Paenibacillus shirakamiensis]